MLSYDEVHFNSLPEWTCYGSNPGTSDNDTWQADNVCDVNGTSCDAIVFSDDMSTTVDQVSLFNNLYIIIISICNPLFHARIQRGWGTWGVDTPGKSQSYRVP